MLKHMFILGVALSVASSSFAESFKQDPAHESKEVSYFKKEEAHKKNLLTKCLLFTRAVSAGSLGAFIAAWGLSSSRYMGDVFTKELSPFEKFQKIVGLSGLTCTSLALASQLGNYTVESFREMSKA